MQIPGLVNVDFADVCAIMKGSGSSLMGQGRGEGKGRARDAALKAISSPLLDARIEKATGIVWNITGPSDLTLFEVESPSFYTNLVQIQKIALGTGSWSPSCSDFSSLFPGLTPLCGQVNEAAEVIYGMVDPEADLIFGAVIDSGLDQDVSITLIATGFGVGAFTGSSSAAFLDQKLPAIQPSQLKIDRYE